MLKLLRQVGIFFLAVLGLFCAGCSTGRDGAFDDTAEMTESAVQDEEVIMVGFSQVGAESDWRIANTKSVKDAFRSEDGFYLLYEDAQQKQEKQIKALRNFILQEVDYIILNPILETGWDTVLQEAKDAGIPVIVADRMVDVEDDSLYTCWLGTDVKREGINAGKWLEEYLKEQGREEEEMTFGAIDAIKAAGRTCGPEGDIILISFDAVSAAFDSMLAGDINADFECNPLQGPRLQEIIRDLSEGKTVEKIQYMEETYFDTTMDLEEMKKTREY